MPPLPVAPLPADDLAHILRHTSPLWRELEGTRFFITGGTGFFGLWLLETLAHARQQLGIDLKATVLTRDARAFAAKAPHLAENAMFDWHEGDVRTFPFPPGEFSHIVHAAATSSKPVPAWEMLETLVDGTRHVLRFAAQSRCRRLLLVSSGAVYGIQPPELPRIPETHPHAPDPLDPASAYGEGKRMAELLCAIATQQGIPCAIARCFAFIGPHLPLDAHFAAGNFLSDAARGGPIHVNSDGRALRSYLYMADLMIWLLTILLHGAPTHPYNVGSDEDLSVAELARRVKKVSGSMNAILVRDPPSSAPPPRYVPDICRAQEELGLEVRIGIDEAILRTMNWVKGQ
ncbi:MAG: NAD-dependent epimerase/dehydratase family protein [Zoogloeaceae bacterium]|jgi:dTDP-glucose 4,6-dehydratase|nr:NAD-dependent epimerase/dehydratase family protein [Zoogloeaceae bacterium]